MARFVFFSFAYDDVKNFKVNVVRNSWLLKNREETFVDGSIWGKTKGDAFLIKVIDGWIKKHIGYNHSNWRRHNKPKMGKL